MTKSGDNHAATLQAMGLFISTALLSQILQYELERRRKERTTMALRYMYETKRLSDRLSYNDLTATLSFPKRFPDGMDSLQVRMTDEDAFDHIPKNSNWLHFESSNEEDVKCAAGEGVRASLEGEDDNSSSSSEAFLWTNSGEEQRRRKSRQHSFPPPLDASAMKRRSSEPLGSTWLGRLRQGLGVSDELPQSLSDDYALETRTRHALGSIPSDESFYRHQTPQRHPETGVRRSASTPVMESVDIAENNRSARAHYNARIMPDKVVMIRHGQSEGNVNEALYSTTPDNAMRLTKLGWDQARLAGEVLKNQVLITGVPIHFIVSPYVRTVETFHGIVSAWCDPKEFDHIRDREKRIKAWYGRLLELGLTWHEDPRIREQDFGNYQEPEKIKVAKEERHRFGPFFYRFAHGESASDVFDRVSTFLDSLWRSFDLHKARNYVLVTHGISIRVLLARYFRYSIDQFSLLANPRNCEMVILGHDGGGKLQLDGRYEVKVEENVLTGEKEVKGYTFHKQLRVLPRKYVHKLNVRISYDDKTRPADVID